MHRARRRTRSRSRTDGRLTAIGHGDRRRGLDRGPGGARGRGARRGGEAAGGAGRTLRGDDPARRPAAGRRRRADADARDAARRRHRDGDRARPDHGRRAVRARRRAACSRPTSRTRSTSATRRSIGIASFGGVALVLGAIPLAWLADRMSRVRIVWIATIGWGVATALQRAGREPVPAVLHARRRSASARRTRCPCSRRCSPTRTRSRAARACSRCTGMAQPLGLLIGPFLAGLDRRRRPAATKAGGGRTSSSRSRRAPRDRRAGVAARAGARPLRAGARARRGARRRGRQKELPVSISSAYARLKKIKTFYYICVGIGVLGFALVAVPVQLGLLLEDSYGYGAYTRGWIISLDVARVARRDPDRRARVRPRCSGANPMLVVRLAGRVHLGVRAASWSIALRMQPIALLMIVHRARQRVHVGAAFVAHRPDRRRGRAVPHALAGVRARCRCSSS